MWRVRIGRVRLFLLETDLEENAPWDRELSARLYGGDRETRLQQELILGMGGVRALRALGINPAVWHLNEGHAALVVLQRIRELIERGQSFDDALKEVRRTTVLRPIRPCPPARCVSFGQVEKHLSGVGERSDPIATSFSRWETTIAAGPAVQPDSVALRPRRRQRRQQTPSRGDERHVANAMAPARGSKRPLSSSPTAVHLPTCFPANCPNSP